jgi:hypothetical protein
VRRRSWLQTLLVTAFIGCVGRGSQDRPDAVVVRDSAGVTIIDNGTLPPLDPGDSFALEVTIGVSEGAPEYQLFQVRDAKRLGDGAIAVLNSGTRELRIYEADGTHRVTAGGAGQGPGEFRYPTALVVLPGDTIQVQDFVDRVYFASHGELLRRETKNRQTFNDLILAGGGFSEAGAWLADGTYFAPIYELNQGPRRPGPLFRPKITFSRVPGDFSAVDTLGQFGGILQQYLDVGGQRGVSTFVPPFATNTSWALGSADGTIIAADNARAQIDRFHPDGTHSIIRWSTEASPVTAQEVEEWKEQQRNASWTRNQLPTLERAWAAMDVPDTKPYYGRVRAGSDGTLWVTSDDLGQGPTVVFGADGHFERSVRFPERFTVYDSGPRWVLGVLHDENDVEYVQLYER